MRIGKKLITYVLVLTICFSMFGSFGITAQAATTRYYSTMDAIPEDLTIFDTMAKGSISAVNVSGVWYYQFTRSGYDTIRVKVSAFTTTSHTNAYLAADNAALTKSVNSTTSTRNDYRWNYYVLTKKRTYNRLLTTSISGNTYVSVDEYTTSRWRSKLTALGATSDRITLKSELTHFVKFTYSSKVCLSSYLPVSLSLVSNCSKIITPVDARGYVAALVRSLSVNSITPVMDISVTNTGDVGAYLNSYSLSGKGIVAQGVNVSKLISVSYKAVKLAVTATPSVGTLYNLYSLINDVADLKPTSSIYNTGLEEPLSMKNIFVYRAKYDSPIKLSKYGDYVQVVTHFANNKSGYSGRGTAQLKVVFSFK